MVVRDTFCLQHIPSFNGLMVFIFYPFNGDCHFFHLWILSRHNTFNSPYIQLPRRFHVSFRHTYAVSATVILNINIRSSKRAQAMSFFFLVLSSHTAWFLAIRGVQQIWIHDPRATVPVSKQSLHCHQYKLDINMPRQNAETICVKFLQKKKQKKKHKRGHLCMWGNLHSKPKASRFLLPEFENCVQGSGV